MTGMKFSLRSLFVLTTVIALCVWIAVFYPLIAVSLVAWIVLTVVLFSVPMALVAISVYLTRVPQTDREPQESTRLEPNDQGS